MDSLSLLPGTSRSAGLGRARPILGRWKSANAVAGSLSALAHAQRVLEWVDYPFSMGTSPPMNCIRVSCIADGFLPSELLGKPGRRIKEQ